MKLVEAFLTRNPCYRGGKKIKVKGIMLHSVGCPQPRASVFIDSWNRADYDRACVHAFIDGNDGTVKRLLSVVGTMNCNSNCECETTYVSSGETVSDDATIDYYKMFEKRAVLMSEIR